MLYRVTIAQPTREYDSDTGRDMPSPGGFYERTREAFVDSTSEQAAALAYAEKYGFPGSGGGTVLVVEPTVQFTPSVATPPTPPTPPTS